MEKINEGVTQNVSSVFRVLKTVSIVPDKARTARFTTYLNQYIINLSLIKLPLPQEFTPSVILSFNH